MSSVVALPLVKKVPLLTRYGKTVTSTKTNFFVLKVSLTKSMHILKLKFYLMLKSLKAMGEDYLNTIEIIHLDTQKKEILGSKDRIYPLDYLYLQVMFQKISSV